MQKKDNRSLLLVIVCWAGVIGPIVTYSQKLFSNPLGGTVVEGSASVGTDALNPNHQIITQTSPKAIINWSSFNIDAHQITEFRQPSADSIALNRVVGGDPSIIMGSLKANGQVWLINPAGILFGRTARVDVAGLVATTADIRNSDFMKGHYLFTQPENRNTSVVNQGQINIADSGIAYLVAPGVRNSGTIRANLGKVVLASGMQYTVDLYGDGLIHFATNLPAISEKPRTTNNKIMNDAVRNSGEILTDGGQVLLTTSDAKQVVENLINMDGVIKANTAVVKKGDIYLYGAGKGVVNVTGKMEAKGNRAGELGGKITITGNKVGLFSKKSAASLAGASLGGASLGGASQSGASLDRASQNSASQNETPIFVGANIDVSGHAGGGEIYIGGSFQGNGPIPNAEATFVAKETKLLANALTKGNGGKIIVWSDKSTRFYGYAGAIGGAQGGNGGLVETSGKWLDLGTSLVEAHSPKGLAGTWLIDPFNVSIQDNPDQNGAYTSAGGTDTWTPSGSPSVVASGGVGSIADRLDAGTNVTITTTGGGAEDGDINNLPNGSIFTVGTGVTLTLQASNNITLGQSITGAGLSLVFNCPGAVTTQGAATINVFALQLGSGSANITPGGGSTVNGNASGSNITFSGQGAGPFLFNGNTLTPPSPPSPSPSNPNTAAIASAITSALAIGNFIAFTGTGTTSISSSTTNSNIDLTKSTESTSTTQSSTSTTQQQSSTTATSTTETSTTATTSTSESTTSTTTTSSSTTSTETTAGGTGTTAPTESTAAPTGTAPTGGEPTATSTTGTAAGSAPNSTADAPTATEAIGGGAEGRETPTNAEGAGGSETAFARDPQAVETTDFGARTPDTNLSPEYRDGLQQTGPMTPADLATEAPDLGKNTGLVQESGTTPVGPESTTSAEAFMGSNKVGGNELGQEQIQTAEGAEGQEGVAEANAFDPNQDIDRSYDDLERVLTKKKPTIPMER